MKKTKSFWRNIKRDLTWSIDYKQQHLNTANVFIEWINRKIVDSFLITLETKGEIKPENFEVIYTALLCLCPWKAIYMEQHWKTSVLFYYDK